MKRAILLKEINKLKYFLIAFVAVFTLFCVLFFYNVNYEVKGIEPHSMMWYRYIYLNYRPEAIFLTLYTIFAIVVSLIQFLPERIDKRVKILLHLPKSSNAIIALHFGFGVVMMILFFLVLNTIVALFIRSLYPTPIALNAFYALFKFSLISIFVYISLSGAIIERDIKLSFLKLAFGIITYYLLINFSFLWTILFIVAFYILAIDSFRSHKFQRLSFTKFIFLFNIIFIVIFGYKIYEDKFKKDGEKFYLFYSPILNEFVYQQNHGGHIFSYKSSSDKEFSEKEYKSFLPFNYHADLKQQGKLLIDINGTKFDEKEIKDIRLAFSFNQKKLKEEHLNLYPFFNPDSSKAVISYSPDMIWVRDDKFVVFHEDSSVNDSLTDELNSLAKEINLEFPIKGVWGKFSNFKPLDAGLFLKDSKGDFYNILRYDDEITFKKIPIDKNIIHLLISENKENYFLGLAFDEKDIYLLKSDYELIKLDIKNFDYKTMRIRVFRDPMFYQVRYDDGKTYYISAFDRELNLIDEFSIE